MSGILSEIKVAVALDVKDASVEFAKQFKYLQSEADKNTITYKIAGDKSSMEAMLKQIQGMKPEVLANIKLDFDKSAYTKEMELLKGTTGKTASEIGNSFKQSIESSLSKFDISSIIGKSLKKGDVLEKAEIDKLRNSLLELKTQTKGFDLKNVTSVTEIENQVVALEKMNVILKTISEHSNRKSIKIDDSNMKISDMLSSNMSDINSVMSQVGDVIHKNASQWTTTLESTFNKEFGNIVNLINNIREVIGGAFDSGSASQFGQSIVDNMQNVQAEIEKTNEEIKKLEVELEKLNKLKNAPIEANGKAGDVKRKLTNYAASNITPLKNNNEKYVTQFKEIVNEYMSLGGKLDELTGHSDKFVKLFNIEQIIPQNTEVIKQIEDVTARLNNLKATRDALLAQQSSATSGSGIGTGTGTGTGTGSGTGTPADAVMSPTLAGDFKQKLQEQITAIGSVDVTVSGKPSETFKSDLQSQVDGAGKVDVGVNFSDAKKDGKKQEIPVDVTTSPKLSDSFKGDLQKLIDDTGKYEVSIKPKDGEKDNYVSLKATVENGEEFKNLLKQAAEGENGLPVKVNPVVDKDFKLEIANATLKDVKVEGAIQGGNLKPASIETPTATTPTTGSNSETASQEKPQQELEKTKQKHEEVGQAAQKSAEIQKRSLLEVVKEIERVDAEQRKLMAQADVTKSNNEMVAFIENKKKQAQEFTKINDLIAKIQSKMAEPSNSKTANLTDMAKHYAGIIEYVERLKILMKDTFSYKVLGENGEQEFNRMKSIVDQVSGSTDDLNKKIIEFNGKLHSLNAEKSGLEKTATDAEKLEVKLYKSVKAVEQLKATNKNGDLINVKSKTFDDFFTKWKEYKAAGGTKRITDFTNEAKVINTVSKAYNEYVSKQYEAKKAAEERSAAEAKTLQKQVGSIKQQLQEKFPEADLSKYSTVFDEVLAKKKSVSDAFAEIRDSIQAAQKAANEAGSAVNNALSSATTKTDSTKQTKPLGKGEVLVTPKVEDPAAFAGQVTEQLKGQSATIDVKPNIVAGSVGEQAKKEGEQVNQTQIPIKVVADITSLNTDIQGKKEQITPVDVKLTANIESLNTDIQSKKEQIVPADVKLTIGDKTTKDLAILSTELNKIVEYINKIVEKPLDIKVDYSSIKGLYEVGKNGVSPIDQLKNSVDGLKTGALKDLRSSLQGFTINENLASRIEEVAKALSVLKITLNNIDPNSTGFLNTIKDLSNQAKGLQNLATVISASKEEIKKAKDEINKSQGKAPEIADKEKYTILKDTLNEVLRLTKEYNKERDSETKSAIASEIQLYKDRANTLQLELSDLEKINAVEQNRVDIIQNKINLEENKQANKELAALERQSSVAKTLNDKLNDQHYILKQDSNEWSHALEVLSLYKNELNDVVKIARNINVDEHTGFKAISYQFTDSKGSTKTVGADYDLLIDNTKIADLNSLYSKLKSSASEYYSLQEKILKGDTSSKTQTNSLIAYNNMLQAQKDIFYWKEKGLVPSKEQLQIEERITALAETYKDQDRKTGLLNMYKPVLNTVDRLNKKQEEVNNLKLKADGSKEFSESIKNAQDNVSTLIATLRGFKFSDFFSADALSHFGLNGSSLLFNNNDLNSLKWVMSQLPLTEEQIQKISDALDKNTLIKERNAAAQNKINDAENKKTVKDRTKEAESTYKAIENSLKKQADLTKQVVQANKDGRVERSKELNSQLVEEFRNYDSLIAKYKTFNDVVSNVDSNLEKLSSDSKHRFSLIGADKVDDEQLRIEKELQRQRDQFYKSNMNGVDFLIQKREEEAKAFSASLKAQMEEEQAIQKEREKAVKGIGSFGKKDQAELYGSLTKATQEYIYWLKEESSATGKAKEEATKLRKEKESLMNSLKADIKAYGLQDTEKELDLNNQILQVKEKIAYQSKAKAENKSNKEQTQVEVNAQKELNSLIDQYISKRNKAEFATNPTNKALANNDSIILFDKIQQKIKSVKDEGILTENQIQESLNKISLAEDELTKRLEVRNNVQKKINDEKAKEETSKGVKSFNQKDQIELYNSLSEAVKQYLYWLKKEQSATGSAKDVASLRRQETESLMNSLKTDIKSYGLQNTEKELDLDRQILQVRREINFQDEQATSNMAKSSYQRELKLEEEKARLQIKNIGANVKTIAGNDVRIKELDSLIQKEQEYRQAMGLEGKAHEASAQLINKKQTLTNNLRTEQEAYNASVKAGNEEAQKKLLGASSGLTGKLSNAISTYTSADGSKLEEAKSLLGKLQSPSSSWNVDSSNVDSIVKKIQSDTDKIVNALKRQHDKIVEQIQGNGQTGKYSDDLTKALSGVSIDGAKFSKVIEAKGDKTATVEFIKQIGNEARTTTLFIKDVDVALNELSKTGKLNVSSDNYKEKAGGLKEVVKTISEVEAAYKGLSRTELEYQQLKAKKDTDTIKNSEKGRLDELIVTRDLYNQKIQESTELTIKEQQAKANYNSKVATVLAEHYDPYVSTIAQNRTKYEADLLRTKQLMEQAFKPNIAGFQSVFDRVQAEVDELNRKLLQGNIENVQTGYTDKINQKVSGLNNVVAVASNIDEAQQMMRQYAETINNGKVQIGNFTNNNKTLTASFKDQNNIIREVALSYNEVTGAISLLDKGTNRAKSTWSSFMDGMRKRLMSLGQYLLTFASFYRIFGYIKQGANYIREFDKALTEMRKVSDETISSLKNFQKTSFDIAASVGTTAKQIQDSTADWMGEILVPLYGNI